MLYSCVTCGRTNETRTCPEHAPKPRRTFAQEGYRAEFKRNRRKLLDAYPVCVTAGCNNPSTVADHHPVDKRTLERIGVSDPDAVHRMRALCQSCHSRLHTKKHGFGVAPADTRTRR